MIGIDLCSGAGGMSLGANLAGIDVNPTTILKIFPVVDHLRFASFCATGMPGGSSAESI